jgi:TonB family protein
VHRVVAFFVLLISVALATSGHAQAPATATTTPAALTKRIPPRSPAKAIERGDEGWVEVRFAITPEGTTSDVHVISSFPRGLFDKNAQNAVAKWIYTPRLENGIAVPQGDNRALLSFALTESTAVRDAYAGPLAAISEQVWARHWDAAAKMINTLGRAGGLNLVELAILEGMRGQVAAGKQDYKSAVACFDRALSITPHLDATTREAFLRLLVMTAINAADFPRAVKAFDDWNPQDVPQTRDLRKTVETLRSALTSGRKITITPPEILP